MMDVLIVCGGTGGHLSPGIAVAEELRRKGHQCRLLISQKQVDSALVQKYPHLEFIKVPGRAFSGGLFARIRSLCAPFSKFPICTRTFKSRSTRCSITLWWFFISWLRLGRPLDAFALCLT